MAFVVISGQVVSGVLYIVGGTQSVIYNSVTYTTFQQFRGIAGIYTFTYTGTGTQALLEVEEYYAGVVIFEETAIDNPSFPEEVTLIKGMAVEFELTDAEKLVNETTNIKGFSIELVDYPFYAFEVLEIEGD